MNGCASSPAPWPRFLPSGDAALSVELGDGVDRRVSAKVVRLHRHLRAQPLRGVAETLPTFRSLLVSFDPRETNPATLQDALTGIISDMSDEPLPSRLWTIPVCYDPEFGLDIQEVAALSGMTPDQVVECQSSAVYYVYMVGFLPGYAYLGDTPEPLRLPRRKNPRTRVPAGSLAIATSFASIYPFESPGGWHIIGRTPVSFFDAAAEEPALLAPGDEIRFEPVPLETYEALSKAGGARPSLQSGAAS
jgi:inhibitor of KinA